MGDRDAGIAVGNTVVVTTEKAKAYALNAATGAVVWGDRGGGVGTP